MKMLPKRILFLVPVGLILVGVSLFLNASQPVKAGGAQPILPGGSSIQPGGETPIQMVSEVITMDVRMATEADNSLVTLRTDYFPITKQPIWYPAVAEVQSTFRLRNPTSEAVSMDILFPLAAALDIVEWNLSKDDDVPQIVHLRVNVDGENAEYKISRLPNPKGADRPQLPWAKFQVTIAGEQETTILLNYSVPLQPSISGVEMTLVYTLHPGSGWAGPVGQVDLTINLPYPASTNTLAGIPAGTLQIPPYYRPSLPAALPARAMLEDNRVSWTWQDLEPDAEDDLAIWLLQPARWLEFESARDAVKADPQDGQAWLELGATYYSFSSNGPEFPTLFSSIYLPKGVQAYQKAVELLPERSAAHAGLALLTLEQYMSGKDAPAEDMQLILDELQITRDLEEKYHSIEKETGRTRWLLAALTTDLDFYFGNEATATAELLAWSTHWATRNTQTAMQKTAIAQETMKPTRISTQAPTESPPVAATKMTGWVVILIVMLAVAVICLVTVVYLRGKRAK